MVLFIVFLALLTIQLVLLWTMSTYHIPSYQLFKHLDASDLAPREAITEFGYDATYRNNFLTVLVKKGIPKVVDHTIEQAKAVGTALLNLGNPQGNSLSGGPYELLEGLSSNAWLLCSDLAQRYGYTLQALGFQVRLMHISRPIFGPWNMHATVEVWDVEREKRIITNPTFDFSFLKNGQYSSLVELYDAVHSPGQPAISITLTSNTSHSHNIDEYYINFLRLLDNTYYASHHYLPGITRFAPFRLVDPRRIVGLVSTAQHPVRSGELYIQNSIVIWVFSLGPILICLIGIILIRESARSTDLRHMHRLQTRDAR